MIYHVLNRANGRDLLFETPASYRDFLRLVSECAERDRMRILAYCIMPNHWHMLLWPHEDGDLFRFVHRLSVRHAKRWHARNGTAGRGHVYQARYKSFVVNSDEHMLTVHRYVEQNPVRARFVATPGAWPWSSAAHRPQSGGGNAEPAIIRIEPSPVAFPEHWAAESEKGQETSEIDRVRACVVTNTPFGDAVWATDIAERIGFRHEALSRGRPRKTEGAPRAPYRPGRRGRTVRTKRSE